MMALQYFEGWFRARRTGSGPLTESEALSLHNQGKPYVVLVGGCAQPSCYIEVVGENGYAGVEFLDENLRSYLVYSFERVSDGRLFLSSVTRRSFQEASDKVRFAEIFHFHEVGLVEVREIDPLLGSERVGEKQINISQNYEAWPDFGSYEHLAVRDRGAAV